MHSQFTYNNPNVHRTAPPNFQQQSGFQHPIYNIGAPPVFSFMTHPPSFMVNHSSFARSFASVVSCENNLEKRQDMLNINKGNFNQNNNNSGIIGSLLRHFNKPSMPHYQHHVSATPTPHKEFEDFTHMPSLSANQFQRNKQSYCQQPSTNPININMMQMPNESQYQVQPSANNSNKNTTVKRGFMAALFGSCPQPQQGLPKSRNQRWFKNSFRYRGGSWRSQANNSGSKLHDHDVNLPKNVHEKERSSIERDIKDDSCDFVHIEKDDNIMSNGTTASKNPNETAKGSCYQSKADDPPFMIYSLEEFPTIFHSCKQVTEKKTPSKNPETNCDQGFVVVPNDATVSTPTFTPKRMSLCEKFIKSPQKLFPTCTQIQLKPCLKASRRRVSECSDDFIVFADEFDDYKQNDITFSDSESETDGEDDDDEMSDDEMSEIIEENDDEFSEEEDIVDGTKVQLEQQVDSGVEEKMVSCPTVKSC